MELTASIANVKPITIHSQCDFYRAMKATASVSTEIVWDLGKISKVIKNKVLKALTEGYSPSWGGDSMEIYDKLTNGLGINHVHIPNLKQSKTNYYDSVTINIPSDRSEELQTECESIYAQQRVLSRLHSDSALGNRWIERYYKDSKFGNAGTLYIVHPYDATNLKRIIKQSVVTPEYLAKVAPVIALIETGAQITFSIKH